MLRTTTDRQARRTIVFCSNSATVLPRNVCDCRRLTGAQASFLAQRVLQSRIAFLNSSMKYTVYRKKNSAATYIRVTYEKCCIFLNWLPQ